MGNHLDLIHKFIMISRSSLLGKFLESALSDRTIKRIGEEVQVLLKGVRALASDDSRVKHLEGNYINKDMEFENR